MSKIPWYKSNTLRGLLAALVLQIANWSGLAERVGGEQEIKGAVELLMQFLELASLVFAGWSRVQQPTPPITEAAAQKWEAL